MFWLPEQPTFETAILYSLTVTLGAHGSLKYQVTGGIAF